MAVLFGLVLTGWGCQQPPTYFYYGYGAPACTPVVPAPAAQTKGKPGEPPTEVIEGGMTSVDAPGLTTTVIGSTTPPRVVVSEPEDRPRGSWRRNPDSDDDIATTVEGGVSTSTNSSVVR
jgi:hypothetical protein